MPRPFETAILTDAGARLLTRSLAGEITVEFTKMAVGNGEYDAAEKSVTKLQKRTELMSQKNSYPFSDISIHDEHSVKLTSLISNQNPVTKDVLVDEGYYINEIGIFAKENGDPDAAEVLYCISITSGDKGDYMPAYNGHSPAQITQDFFATVGNSGEVTIHSAGAVLLRDGNAKDVTVTFAEAEKRENIKTGENLSGIFGKISKFFSDLKTVAFSGSYKDLTDKPTAKDFGLGNVGNFKSVSTVASQGLSDTEKANARRNINVYGFNVVTQEGLGFTSTTYPDFIELEDFKWSMYTAIIIEVVEVNSSSESVIQTFTIPTFRINYNIKSGYFTIRASIGTIGLYPDYPNDSQSKKLYTIRHTNISGNYYIRCFGLSL